MKSQRGWLAGWLCVVVALAAYTAAVPAQERRQRPESRDMRLLGHNDLQARSGYHPAINNQQDGRWIAYVGHHGGKHLNPLTGVVEPNGTSILDVTARCKFEIQTNNVEVDDRGYIYIINRANTGMHVLELTGAARTVADFR